MQYGDQHHARRYSPGTACRAPTSHGGLIVTRSTFFALPILLALVVGAWAQAPYYQGKTITIITGSQTGDVFDIYARMIAAHIGKHIPGNPNAVVQNMTGAGHIVAANFVYSVAKPDGLTLLAPNPNLYVDQLIGRSEIKFDWAKFS